MIHFNPLNKIFNRHKIWSIFCENSQEKKSAYLSFIQPLAILYIAKTL